MDNFEIHYSIAFPSLRIWAPYFDSFNSIGITTAIKIGETILEMLSHDQRAVLATLIATNEDIKNACRISIVKNSETHLDVANTDTLSWEVANYLLDKIKN